MEDPGFVPSPYLVTQLPVTSVLKDPTRSSCKEAWPWAQNTLRHQILRTKEIFFLSRRDKVGVGGLPLNWAKAYRRYIFKSGAFKEREEKPVLGRVGKS